MIASAFGRGDLLWAIPLGVALVTGGWKGIPAWRHAASQRRRLVDAILGADREGRFPAQEGLLDQVSRLLTEMTAVARSVARLAHVAEKANRTAIAAHKRLDRAGFPRSWDPDLDGPDSAEVRRS